MATGQLTGTQIATKDYLIFSDFETMDTHVARVACPPNRLPWCENLQPIGPNQLTTVPAPNTALTSIAGKTALKMWFAFYNNVNYEIVAETDGSMFQVNLASGVATQIAPAGTFSNPDVTVWRSSVLLIADAQAGYSVWNGSALSKAGGISPQFTIVNGGTGYSGTPTATIVGGSGAGATATVQTTGNVVTGLTLTNGGTGFLPGDILSGNVAATASWTTATPNITMTANPGWVVPGMSVWDNTNANFIGTVLTYVGTALVLTANAAHASTGSTDSLLFSAVSITGGGGTGAFATVKVWPTLSVTPTTLAVFAGRVWLGGGRGLAWTGTQGFDDANPANASGSTTIPDADLVHQITALRSLNNFLWIFGDNSIKQIGTVSISGSTTVFNIVTLTSDTGTTFPQTIQSYNRLVLFANMTGVYAVLGSSVQKVSQEMDGIFKSLDFSILPCAALNDINAIRCYLLLVRYIDPLQARTRTLLLTFQSKIWFVCAQGDGLLAMSTAVIGGSLETFGSSGADVTQLLQSVTTPVAIFLQTALAHHGKPFMGKRALRAGTAQSSTGTGAMTFTIDTENSSINENYTVQFPITWLNALGGVVTWVNSLSQLVTFSGSGFLWQRTPAAGTGIYLGMTLRGTFAGYSFNNAILEYQEATAMASKTSA